MEPLPDFKLAREAEKITMLICPGCIFALKLWSAVNREPAVMLDESETESMLESKLSLSCKAVMPDPSLRII
jgi:hypothetical protein